MKKVAVIGLGYVGLPLAIEFAKSRNVIGFDINSERIDQLLNGIDNTNECTVDSIRSAKNITFSSNNKDIKDSDIYIVTVPTPVNNSNRPDLRHLKNACKLVGEYLDKGNFVIFESTVYPGATEEICVPILEQKSHLSFNKDFFCGYSPERINPGDKVNTLTTIKKITSGSNKLVADEIDALYCEIITAGTWKASSIKVAEAAKVIENSQRDLNIAFVNELSLIFDKIGIDTIEVLEAAGSKWNFLPFRPGMVGGHCIGVDPYYLTHKAEEVGYNPEVILAGRRINDEMAKNAARSIIKKMLLNQINLTESTIGVFGITFKDNCPDIRNSKVFDLINELESWGANVIIFDSWANPDQVKKEYGYSLSSISDTTELDSIIVAVGHDEFKEMNVRSFKSMCSSPNPVFGDLKSIFKKDELESNGFTVHRL